MHVSASFIPRIERRLTLPVPLDLAVLDQLLQRVLNGCLADGRHQLHDFALGELAELLADCSADQLDGGQLLVEQIHTVLEVPVGRQDDAQQVLDEGRRVITALVPAFAAYIQHLVIPLLGLLNLALQTDIAAHHIAAAVQQQGGQQSGHSAISVVEGVDAQKIVDENGDQHQPVKGIEADGRHLGQIEGTHLEYGQNGVFQSFTDEQLFLHTLLFSNS